MGIRLILSLMLVGIFLVLYVFPLGVRPLVIPDEARYAEIPREMLASGDWIVPRLDGLRYFEKPPLGYWLNAGAIWLFGENVFAIRLPSAVAVGLTALVLFVWARRFTGDDATPLLATAVFLLSFEVLAIGVFCVLDSVLSLFVTAAIVALYLAYEPQTPRTRMLLLVLAGVACGLAFLTKGFLALAVPVIVIVPFAMWQGRLRICLRTAWAPLVTAFLVALPWGILIHRREPDFWHYFFWVEHVDRFMSAGKAQHPYPFWFYGPILIAGAMPWTPLVGTIVQGLRHANRNQPMIRLAICWLVLPFLLFSASSGKLGTYILPCFPPLAFLIAVGLLRCLGEGDTKGFVVGIWVLMLAAGSLLVALIVALFTVPGMYDRVTLWRWGIAAAGLLFWVVFCRAARTRNHIHSRLALYCAGPVLFMFSWHFICAAAVQPKKTPGAFLLSHVPCISGSSIFIAENDLAGVVCWYSKHNDVIITGGTGEYAYGLSYEDSRRRMFDVKQVEGLIVGQAREGPVFLVVSAKCYAQFEGQLPKPCREERRDGLVWAEYPPPARSLLSESAD
jgi:4-amino-4-deoxy-L-arabinose transferase